jgi:hypothetical protein
VRVKNSLAAVSVIGLIGASGFVAWTALSRPDPTVITSEQARSFDISERATPDAPPAAQVREVLRDAVAAAPVSPRPIPLESMAAAPARAAAAPVPPRVRPFLTPQLEKAVLGSRLFAALLRSPARFAVSRSALKSVRDFRAFMDDKGAVETYMSSTLMRVVLNSPAVAKAVLSNPALIRAFVESPAMRDPRVVRELVSSRMAVKMLDCPGIQEALTDPAVMSALADPAVASWMERNPEALSAVASAVPALARSLTR